MRKMVAATANTEILASPEKRLYEERDGTVSKGHGFVRGAAVLGREIQSGAADVAVEELAAMLRRHCVRDGWHGSAIEGYFLTRFSTPEAPRSSLDRAVFCVVAQGAKSIHFGGKRLLYGPGSFLLVSEDLPLVGQIEQASRTQPFLGVSLTLDFQEIASLIAQGGLAAEPQAMPGQTPPGLEIGQMDAELMDAVLRLTRLLDRPAEAAVLAPLVRREIFYRLLKTGQCGLLRRMTAMSAGAQRIAAGLRWLRQHAFRPVRMEELARELHMSQSSMYAWFRTVTGMSPLEYQKQLRLQEARRVMLAEAADAGEAARRVGYESASQFTREYRRFFGDPPMRDMEKLRALIGMAGTSAGRRNTEGTEVAQRNTEVFAG